MDPVATSFGVLRCFYSILLEDVPEEKFLGTICSVTQGTITTLQPVDATLLHTLKSVGNREHAPDDHSAYTTHAIDTATGGGLN